MKNNINTQVSTDFIGLDESLYHSSEDEWYKEYWPRIKEDTSTWGNFPSFREDPWDQMSQSKTKKKTENQQHLLDAAYQQIRNERLVKEEKKNQKIRTEFERMESRPKVVSPEKEKNLNKEWIEAVQEDIIEKEEYVPAFRNIPKDRILKPEKARRRIKKNVLGQITVHCPFCKIKTRSQSSMEKHLLQIHLETLKKECEPDIETARGKLKKKNGSNFKFAYKYITKDNENFHVKLLPTRPSNSENKQLFQHKEEEGHKSSLADEQMSFGKVEKELKNGTELKVMSKGLGNGREALKKEAQKKEKGPIKKDNLSWQSVIQGQV